MLRYVAFLRAINVGGHTVKMDALRRHFAALGFADVETFIASGNVVFDTTAKNTHALEKKIEQHLFAVLGYEVATFIRTDAELAAIAQYQPFSSAALKKAQALNVAFLTDPLDAASQKKLAGAEDGHRRLPRARSRGVLVVPQEAERVKFSNAVFEKTLGQLSDHARD